MALRAAWMRRRLSRSRDRSDPTDPIQARRITLHPCGAKRHPCSSVFSAPGVDIGPELGREQGEYNRYRIQAMRHPQGEGSAPSPSIERMCALAGYNGDMITNTKIAFPGIVLRSCLVFTIDIVSPLLAASRRSITLSLNARLKLRRSWLDIGSPYDENCPLFQCLTVGVHSRVSM
jgi:hypothetical protein